LAEASWSFPLWQVAQGSEQYAIPHAMGDYVRFASWCAQAVEQCGDVWN
jgi:hypothetical protein